MNVYLTSAAIKLNLVKFHSGTGITKVGVTRGGNWRCHPLLFPEKNDELFLLITVVTFYWFHSGVTPWRVSPAPFLPIRPYLSTIHRKKIFPSGVTLLKDVTRGSLLPSTPDDTTAHYANPTSTNNMLSHTVVGW